VLASPRATLRRHGMHIAFPAAARKQMSACGERAAAAAGPQLTLRARAASFPN